MIEFIQRQVILNCEVIDIKIIHNTGGQIQHFMLGNINFYSLKTKV